MTAEEIKKINAELELISEEERKEIERVCGPNFNWWNIPAYIRKENEEKRKAQALSQQGEEYRQEEKERKEKEDLEMFLAENQL